MDSEQKVEVFNKLEDIVGRGYVTMDEVDLACYARDRMFYYVGSTKYGRRPDFVVLPHSTEDISRLVCLANDFKIPVVVWGGGTNVSGSCVPIHGGIVVDMRGMDRIIEINEESFYVVAQTGITLGKLQEELRKHGFVHGTQPGSMPVATLGGSLCLESQSVYQTKYGNTPKNTISLEVVTPTGKVIRTPRAGQITGGYNLNQLFARSEGTLGIVTEMTLRIHPAPEKQLISIFAFKNFEKCFEAQYRIFREPIDPSICLVWDRGRGTIDIQELEELEWAQGFLVLGLEGISEVVEIEHKIACGICEKRGGQILSSRIADNWWADRFGGTNSKITSEKGKKLGFRPKLGAEVVSVSRDKILGLVSTLKKIIQTNELTFLGTRIHWDHFSLALRFDPRKEDEIRKYEKVVKEFSIVLREYGGTTMASQGCGLRKKPVIEIEFGAGLETMKTIKRSLDPNNIMNPGKIFDL